MTLFIAMNSFTSLTILNNRFQSKGINLALFRNFICFSFNMINLIELKLFAYFACRYDINGDQWLPFTSIKKNITSETVIPIVMNSKIFIFIIEKSKSISLHLFNPLTQKLKSISGPTPKLFENPMPFIFNGVLKVYGYNVSKRKHEIYSYNHVTDKWNVRHHFINIINTMN